MLFRYLKCLSKHFEQTYLRVDLSEYFKGSLEKGSSISAVGTRRGYHM